MAIEVSLYLGLLGLTLILWYLYQRRPRYKLPPGPPPLPILGNVLQIDKKRGMHNICSDWADQYGELFTYWQFRQPVVVLSGKDIIREALVSRSVEFADRPDSFSLHYIGRGKALGFRAFSEAWKHQKKVATNALKMYGDGMANLENISREILEDFTQHLQSFGDQPVAIGAQNRKAIINVITSMVFGKKFAWDEPDFELLKLATEAPPSITPSSLLLDTIPWIRHFVSLAPFERLQRSRTALDEFFSRHLKIVKDNFDPNDIRCFADSLYQQLLKEENQPNPVFDYETYVMTIFAVFLAGFATTSLALSALILVLLHNPEIENKMVAEIIDVLGEDRLPALDDKEAMPYTNAVILELLRYISHVPFALPHMTTANVDIRGYTIPKGTLVYMNVFKLHHDKTLWEDPWSFCPERFLEPDTGKVVPPGHPTKQCLLPFGAGRRICLGEALAKNRLFLFVAGLYQKFKFLPVEGVQLPSCDSRNWTFQLALQTPIYDVRIQPRHS